MADFYELLGVARAARPTSSSGRTARRRASCTPTPTRRPGAGRALQGGRPGLRGALRPRPAGPLRPLRRGRRRRRRRAAHATTSSPAAGSTTCSTPSSAAQSPFGGGAPARPEPARRVARTWRSSPTSTFEQAVFGATVPVTLKLPQRCADCGGSGAGAGTAAGDVRRLQRRRARCSGCARACSARWSPAARARAAAASARSS